MNGLSDLRKWFASHRAQIREEYFHFLRFKSVSADPECALEMKKCSDWLKHYIDQSTDLKAEIIPTSSYPLVYAENLEAGPEAPTLLLYGHYDVQPVDPLELWESDPFEPTERNGSIYARGAADNKGQIFYALTALKACRELGYRFPVNLKLCIEGEEESSSKGLSDAIASLKEKFKADFLLVIDFDQYDPETPALSLGARGLFAFEVRLTGSKSDLHSGIHGGMAYNPNKALVQLLAQLWDEKGRVAVPGFYDDVVEPTLEEKSLYPFFYDEEKYQKEFGIGAIGGEKGLSLRDKNWFRPVLEINGIGGGYTGSGVKTVIPAQAVAKLSARIVPHQDPEKLFRLVEKFLKGHVPLGMKIEVISMGGEPAFRSRLDSKLAKAVALASTEVTGNSCKNILCGASIPIIAKMIRELGCEMVGMGYELPTDAIHAPNEHFDWPRFERGFLTVARTLELL